MLGRLLQICVVPDTDDTRQWLHKSIKVGSCVRFQQSDNSVNIASVTDVDDLGYVVASPDGAELRLENKVLLTLDESLVDHPNCNLYFGSIGHCKEKAFKIAAGNSNCGHDNVKLKVTFADISFADAQPGVRYSNKPIFPFSKLQLVQMGTKVTGNCKNKAPEVKNYINRKGAIGIDENGNWCRPCLDNHHMMEVFVMWKPDKTKQKPATRATREWVKTMYLQVYTESMNFLDSVKFQHLASVHSAERLSRSSLLQNVRKSIGNDSDAPLFDKDDLNFTDNYY
eukprot:gene622-111_t